jgi:hypothetical protein
MSMDIWYDLAVELADPASVLADVLEHEAADDPDELLHEDLDREYCRAA